MICLSAVPTGDTLYYRFISDMSNTEWGYRFTVTGGHRGRFQTGTVMLFHALCAVGFDGRYFSSNTQYADRILLLLFLVILGFSEIYFMPVISRTHFSWCFFSRLKASR